MLESFTSVCQHMPLTVYIGPYMNTRDQVNAVGVTTTIRAEQRSNIRATPRRGKIYFYSAKNLRPLLGPTHPPTCFPIRSSFAEDRAAGA
jgi:hypothetical protein